MSKVETGNARARSRGEGDTESAFVGASGRRGRRTHGLEGLSEGGRERRRGKGGEFGELDDALGEERLELLIDVGLRELVEVVEFVAQKEARVVDPESEARVGARRWEVEETCDLFPEFVEHHCFETTTDRDLLVQREQVDFPVSDLWDPLDGRPFFFFFFWKTQR